MWLVFIIASTVMLMSEMVHVVIHGYTGRGAVEYLILLDSAMFVLGVGEYLAGGTCAGILFMGVSAVIARRGMVR